MAESLLELRDVTVRFGGVTALDSVALTVPTGQVIGVIGPNGAGKTTLFNVICGFVRLRSGAVIWKGQSLRRHRPHDLVGLGIGRTFQGLGLFPGLTVLENVMTGAAAPARTGVLSTLLALPRTDRAEAAIRTRAMERLTMLGIADAAHRLPGELPHGLRKRVALARTLAADPELLLLDEPTTGLSDEEIHELQSLIPTLSTSVVLVEHRMDLIMSVCDDVAVLDFGKLIARGSPQVIRDDPSVIAAYLGEDVNGRA